MKKYTLSLCMLTIMFFSIFGMTKSNALVYGDFSYRYQDGYVVIEGYNGTNGTVTIPNKINGFEVKIIDSKAFFKNDTIEKVIVSEGVEEIGISAFYTCNYLREVVLPSTLKSLGQSAFYGCTNLEKVNLPNNLKSIYDWTFAKCQNLKEIVIPDSVTAIGERVFQECYNLEKVTMSNNIRTIGYWAFYSCRNLISMELPKSLESLGSAVFKYCTNLQSVKIYSDNVRFSSLPIFEDCPNLVVYGYKGSTAETYTSKYKISFLAFKEISDIKGHWAEKTIESFIDKGFINGYEDNTFKPNNDITRAEFVKVVNKVFGFNQKGTVTFNDVKSTDWFYDEIAIAQKSGYINGKSATTFAPQDKITRQEVAVILTNIMNNKDTNYDKINQFTDGYKTSSWAKSSVEGAIEAGYLSGDDKGLLNPTSNITRAEAITMLSRVN